MTAAPLPPAYASYAGIAICTAVALLVLFISLASR